MPPTSTSGTDANENLRLSARRRQQCEETGCLYCVALLVVSLLLSEAAEIRLLDSLDSQRERLLDGYRFVYQVQYRTNRHEPTKHPSSVKLLAQADYRVVCHRLENGAISFRIYPAQGKAMLAETGGNITVGSEQSTLEWSVWFDEDCAIYVFGAFGRSPQQVSQAAYVFPTPGRSIYHFTRFLPPDGYPREPLDFLILSNSNIFQFAQARWELLETQGQRRRLRGRFVGRFRDGVVILNVDEDGLTTRIEAQYDRATTYRAVVQKTRVINQVRVPERLAVTLQGRTITAEAQVQLTKVEKVKDEPLQIPLGTSVNDYRLLTHQELLRTPNPSLVEEVTRYAWDGTLPNRE